MTALSISLAAWALLGALGLFLASSAICLLALLALAAIVDLAQVWGRR